MIYVAGDMTVEVDDSNRERLPLLFSNKSVVSRPLRINLRKKDVTAQRRDHPN